MQIFTRDLFVIEKYVQCLILHHDTAPLSKPKIELNKILDTYSI